MKVLVYKQVAVITIGQHLFSDFFIKKWKCFWRI